MKSSKFSSAQESSGLLFWQVATMWQRTIKKALHTLELSHTQFVLLAVIQQLSEEGRVVTQKEISDYSQVDVMTVSSVLRLLEKRGWINRLAHPTDTRANQIRITIEGEKLVHLAIPLIEGVDEEFFFQEPEKLKEFMTLLTELKNK
ncbi:MAG: MarR family transcriptional regulator [Negativicutes bacterium]|nr:MarR family transcriptional regulator [Negativicutes bacterium]